jgi:hypothetical protein
MRRGASQSLRVVLPHDPVSRRSTKSDTTKVASRFLRRLYGERPLYWSHMLLTGQPTGNMPRSFWESIRPLRLVMQVGALISILLLVLVGGLIAYHGLAMRLLREIGLFGALLVAGINGVAVALVQRIALRRFAVFLQHHNWLVCSQCGYLLNGLGDKSRCPECAGEFSRPDLEVYWRDWLRGHSRGQFLRRPG